MTEQPQPNQVETKIETSVSNAGGSTHCSRCKRPLKNPIYVQIGMGKICLSKSNHPNKSALLTQILTNEQKLREEKKAQKQQAIEKERKVTEQAFMDTPK